MSILLVIWGIFLGLCLVVLYPAITAYEQQRFERLVENNHYRMELVGAQLKEQVDAALADVRLISVLPSFGAFLAQPTELNRAETEQAVKVVSEQLPLFSQIRFLDRSGQEQWRINHDGIQAEIVPVAELQNKAYRYYFQNALDAQQNDITISPLDLNAEGGYIQQPWEPTLRISLKLDDDDGKLQGVLVVNYRANIFLAAVNEISSVDNIRTNLLNPEGYWIIGDSLEQSFGFMFPDGVGLPDFEPSLWNEMQSQDAGHFRQEGNLDIFHRIYPLENTPDYYWIAHRNLSSDLVGAQSFFSGSRGILFSLFGLLITGVSSYTGARFVYSRRRALAQSAALAKMELNLEKAERQAAQSRSQEVEDWNQIILKTFNDVLITTDDRAIITSVNEAVFGVFGYKPEQVLGKNIALLMPERDGIDHPNHIARHYSITDPDFIGNIRHNAPVTGKRANGEEFPLKISLSRTFVGGNLTFVGSLSDISVQDQQQRTIEKMALYDDLTGLPNRRFLFNKLQVLRQRVDLSHEYAAVIISDLDEFKYVNDTLGHAAGDEILRELGDRISNSLPSNALLGRLGGDEFLIVFENLGTDYSLAEQGLTGYMNDLQALIRKPMKSLSIRAMSSSFGAVLFNDSSLSSSEMMRYADIAMYETKRRGKCGYSIFDETMHQRIMLEESLADDLKTALDNNVEIEPWFQPKVDENQQWVGFESLVRWRHPKNGLIAPDDFLPIAETKNLINQLGHRVLELSCIHFVAWRQRYAMDHWTLSVNISQSQLNRADFPEEVEQMLKLTGMPGEALILEITESQIAEDLKYSIEQIIRLRSLGVSFSLDDFGTGYSSLSYLRQLPIDELKIDRSFVNDIPSDPLDEAIVQSIIQVAKALNLVVVAEGVEDSKQLDILQKLQCDLYQGYYFCKPLPASEIELMLNK